MKLEKGEAVVMKLSFSILLISLIVITGLLSSCQRRTFDLGMTEAEKDAPNYTVAPDINGPAKKISKN